MKTIDDTNLDSVIGGSFDGWHWADEIAKTPPGPKPDGNSMRWAWKQGTNGKDQFELQPNMPGGLGWQNLTNRFE